MMYIQPQILLLTICYTSWSLCVWKYGMGKRDTHLFTMREIKYYFSVSKLLEVDVVTQKY